MTNSDRGVDISVRMITPALGAGDVTTASRDKKASHSLASSSGSDCHKHSGSETGSASGVERSVSGASRLSSSSSGFSSISTGEKQQQQQQQQLASDPFVRSSNAALARLQQLQERRAAFHHPSFANHFGFGRSGTGLRANSKTSMDESLLLDRRAREEELFAFNHFAGFPSFTRDHRGFLDLGGFDGGDRRKSIGESMIQQPRFNTIHMAVAKETSSDQQGPPRGSLR